MPRGVTIPEIKQRLFAAAEHVIAHEGPGSLSSRSVTSEAGVATGLLYAHFTNLDQFLVHYAVDRAFQVSTASATLVEKAGTNRVAENLYDAFVATAPTTITALARLHAAQPALAGRVDSVLGDRTAGLDSLENAAATYLATEQQLGRIPAMTDPDTLALALIGALHRLLLTTVDDSDFRTRVHSKTTALLDTVLPVTPHNTGVPGSQYG